MTPDFARVARGRERGFLRAAARFGARTAGRETAAHRKRAEVGRLAGNLREPRALLSQARHGVQQASRVWMSRRTKQIARGARLHHLPGVHHDDPVAELRRDGKVVGDEDDGRLQLRADGPKEIEDLRLHAHVQGRRRLVRDQQRWSPGDAHADHDPLRHTAAELVRIRVHLRFRVRNPHPFEDRRSRSPHIARAKIRMRLEYLRDLIANREDGVERGHGILEDHGHFAAPEQPHLGFGQHQDVDSLEQNAPGGDSPRKPHQPQQRQRGNRFSAAAFADETDDLPRPHAERHAVGGAHRSLWSGELDAKILDLQQWRFAHR